MRQQDDLRVNGELHHYQLDQALFGLQGQFPDDQKIKDLRDSVGKKPPKAQVLKHAEDAMALLRQYQPQMNLVQYANVFHLIDHAKQLASA